VSEITVTDSMIEAAINRLNSLHAADAAHEATLLPWAEICREIYLAMEECRRGEVDAAIAANPVAAEMMSTMLRRYSNIATAAGLRRKFYKQH